ncbi:hypothetical protein TNCV_1305011 [Trichonephila clavipes]|nr:hypothetical protein TNCV_1305011 [Trichonephila clavipes]
MSLSELVRWYNTGQSDLDPSWPPKSPDLSSCNYFLWKTLKSKVYRSNHHSRQKLQQNISDEITTIPEVQLQSAFHNLLIRTQRWCQEKNGGHFQHLL